MMLKEQYHQLTLILICILFQVAGLYIPATFGQTPSARQITVGDIRSLRYINTHVLPHKTIYQGTTVGGLSGIDYDPVSGQYYLISDDRSSINPARFYTAKIGLSETGITEVNFISVDTLRQKNGLAYPRNNRKSVKATDPEAIRYNPRQNELIWTSEGERIIKDEYSLLIDPTINIVSANGRYIDTIPLTQNLRMSMKETGPRRNGVLEALTFAEHYRKLYVCLEEPLYQDGPRPELSRNGSFIRFYQYDLKRKRNTAQYAYELEPIPEPPGNTDIESNNGVPDILWLGADKFLVTERSYTGGVNTHLKIFIASFKNADNIMKVQSLIQTPVKRAMSKKLILDMDTLGIYVDNIEGATFGPRLTNGHRTLIFVSDDNFLPQEQTQFMLFEILE